MFSPFDVFDAPQPQHKRKDGLVDDYETLSLSKLGRGLLRDNGLKTGYATLTDFGFWPRVKYEVEKKTDGTVVLKIWREAAKNSAQFFQEVRLDKVHVPFGWRPFMVCDGCDKLRSKLHFNLQGIARCRDCLNLTYESSRTNHGHPMLRLARRYMKLRLKQTDVQRIDYAGRMTRKARSVVHMANKWIPKKPVDCGRKLEYTH